MDDVFMRKALKGRKGAVQELLRVILDMDDLEVVSAETQENLDSIGGRSICLDVWARDSTGRLFNVEIENRIERARPKRARYHCSMIDVSHLGKGEDFEKLPEVYVVFITEQDALGLDLPLYTVDRTVAQAGLPFGDQSHIVYVNGARRDDTPLGLLVQDLHEIDPGKMHYKELAACCRYYKETEEGMEEMRHSVVDEIREEGGLQMLMKLVQKGVLSIVDAAEESGMSEDEFRKLVDLLSGVPAK
jgi:hypothetical protein